MCCDLQNGGEVLAQNALIQSAIREVLQTHESQMRQREDAEGGGIRCYLHQHVDDASLRLENEQRLQLLLHAREPEQAEAVGCDHITFGSSEDREQLHHTTRQSATTKCATGGSRRRATHLEAVGHFVHLLPEHLTDGSLHLAAPVLLQQHLTVHAKQVAGNRQTHDGRGDTTKATTTYPVGEITNKLSNITGGDRAKASQESGRASAGSHLCRHPDRSKRTHTPITMHGFERVADVALCLEDLTLWIPLRAA